jgi:hypothetical protein
LRASFAGRDLSFWITVMRILREWREALFIAQHAAVSK